MIAGKAAAIESVKQDLLLGTERIFSKDDNSALSRVVRRLFPEQTRAFLLHYIPEQGEDIYWMLMNSEQIAKIEIARNGGIEACEATLEIITVDDYKSRRPSRLIRRRLQIALTLIEKRNS